MTDISKQQLPTKREQVHCLKGPGKRWAKFWRKGTQAHVCARFAKAYLDEDFPVADARVMYQSLIDEKGWRPVPTTDKEMEHLRYAKSWGVHWA